MKLIRLQILALYNLIFYSLLSTFAVNRADITGQNPAHPGIPIVAPIGATNDAIFSLTLIFSVRFSMFAAIEPTDDWVVNPIA